VGVWYRLVRRVLVTWRITHLLHVDLGLGATPPGPPPDFKEAKARAVAEFERKYLERLLASTGGNISLASRVSRKDRSALTKLVKKHGLAPNLFRAHG